MRIKHVVGYSFVSSVLGGALAVGTLPVLPVEATAAASAARPVEQAAPAGPRTELPGKRTATSRTFKNADGSRTTALYPSPVHYSRTRQRQSAQQPTPKSTPAVLTSTTSTRSRPTTSVKDRG